MPRIVIDMNAAAGVHAAGRIKVIALSSVKVVGAMGRRCVNGPCSLIGSDIVSEHSQNAAVQKGVLKGDALELGAFETGQLLDIAEFAGGGDRSSQFSGGDIDRRAIY